MIARAIWKLSQFSKRVNFQNARAISVQSPGSNFGPYSKLSQVSAEHATGVQRSQFEILTVCL